MQRNDFLKMAGAFSMSSFLAACSKSDTDITPSTGTGTSTDTGSTTTTSGTCSTTVAETDGPYPLYTSRGSGITRVDITDGKTGIPLNMALTIQNTNASCAVLANAIVDIWHCDKDGYYSGYTNSGYLGNQNNTSKTFLRGRQTTDSSGNVKFTTIYPGWYTGRLTHIHVQIYVGTTLKLTTQIAFPDDITKAVYATTLYSAHGQNSLTIAQDNVFSDGTTGEMATVTANSAGGYDLTHTIKVAA